MKRLLLYILLLNILIRPVSAQHPPWYFINTVHNHIVLVLNTIPILIDTVPMQPGDYIGAFYTFNGFPICGSGTGATGDVGGMMLTGAVNAITIWGAEPNVFNGFQAGEEFKWKVWRASDGSVFDAFATYDIITLPDSGNYVDEGLSKLASLQAYNIPGINLSVNSQSSPVSSCGYLNPQPVTILLQNHDTIDVVGFNVYFKLNNGDTITNFVTDTIFAGGYYEYTFDSLINLSNIGVYNFYVWVNFPGDVNNTNDYNSKQVIISESPSVSVGSDRAICDGDSVPIMTDGIFVDYQWSNGSEYDYIFAGTEGYYSVTITDDLGCNGADSMYLTVYPEPQIDLIDEISICENGYANVTIHERYQSIKWSNGLLKPNLYITYPGTYWVTVTDFAGCSTVDSLIVIEIPIPDINLGEDITTLIPDTIQIDAGSDFDNYYWSTGDTTQIISPDAFGIFSVTVTKDGCQGSDEITIEKQDTLQFVSDLLLLPNPVSTELKIAFPTSENVEICIYNSLGQFIYSRHLKNRFAAKINVSEFNQGVYIIYVKADSSIFSKRFLKVD